MPRVLPPPVHRLCRSAVILLVAILAAACSEPPSKEMHQAQGAIDAARAAGAEQYASEELKAAVDALAEAEVAVTARDFRLALSLALDSREFAQGAAKAAVDGRAKARGDAERELAEAVALVERAEARLKAPESAKLPRRVLAPLQKQVDTASTSLQEARTSLAAEEYDQIVRTATAVTAQIQAVFEALDAAAAQPERTRRR